VGWKRIKNGSYYYQSRRVGGRAVSDYVPVSIAPLAAQLDAYDRERREMKAVNEREKRKEWDELDRVVDDALSKLSLLARAGLVERGYHQHKWQWRKRRARPDEETP
jgi:hypothetical protein